jgi:hypothetical protein
MDDRAELAIRCRVSPTDHLDSSANFERPGRTPYLYYTRVNDNWLDRDVVRVPVTFMLED